MAIEDDNMNDREVWTEVSRGWYAKASDKAPTTGRLYHHLAILARPNAVQQLFYYTKSLCVPIPFLSARESIMTLLDPVLQGQQRGLSQIDSAFVRVHGVLFAKKDSEKLGPAMDEFFGLLDNSIGRLARRWLEIGYQIAIINCCSLLEYGDEESAIMKELKPQKAEGDVVMGGTTRQDWESIVSLVLRTYEIVLRRFGDPNIFAYLHITMVFMRHLTQHPPAMALLEGRYPWKLTALMLNTFNRLL